MYPVFTQEWKECNKERHEEGHNSMTTQCPPDLVLSFANKSTCKEIDLRFLVS